MTTNALMEKAQELVNMLDWNGCIDLYNKLPKGDRMIDLVFDRMEEIDAERFENWL